MTRNVTTATLLRFDVDSRANTTGSQNLVSGSYTVTSDFAFSTSVILTGASSNNNLFIPSYSINTGVNFAINSTSPSDNSDINWMYLKTSDFAPGVVNPPANLIVLDNTVPNRNYGRATLSGGSVTINCPYAGITSSNIFVCPGRTPNPGVRGVPYAVENAFGQFFIRSTNASDNNEVYWFVLVGTTDGFTLNDRAGLAVLDNSVSNTQNFGLVTLSSGSASVSNINVTSNSIIFVSYKTILPNISNASHPYAVPNPGTSSIDFNSLDPGDNSVLAWWFIENSQGII
jgi:hypothetical protein